MRGQETLPYQGIQTKFLQECSMAMDWTHCILPIRRRWMERMVPFVALSEQTIAPQLTEETGVCDNGTELNSIIQIICPGTLVA